MPYATRLLQTAIATLAVLLAHPDSSAQRNPVGNFAACMQSDSMRVLARGRAVTRSEQETYCSCEYSDTKKPSSLYCQVKAFPKEQYAISFEQCMRMGSDMSTAESFCRCSTDALIEEALTGRRSLSKRC
jgi:hypothetical protein